ncbi:YdcF family protein [Granulicella tundricola]|uniref:DUF218 domain-containing protein n=1 Tax=Granulicella tundricola (strain ATCC BAA-1859 / DSM 23138 / MP5ACTX9) TaxID=1198114 RepID=E8X4J8_GRATM|nr:YdcF family protein [Granulicella tundricola]ADW69408.1 protein of unknown function DUF218 [Granulicella tundricola MP5ACTX9]
MSERSNLRRNSGQFEPKRTHPFRRFLLWCFCFLVLAAMGWSSWVVRQINLVAAQDQAQPADAIAVFGAAEYSGRPSPVYHARLDHAVTLYRKQIAPIVITFGGGSDKDSGKTEGGVGRDYLLANGIPFDKIIAETHSVDTEQQVELLAQIAEENNLSHIVLVSDNTHLFRIQELCRRAGLDVYTSPRPALGHIDSYDLFMRYFHEVLSYTAMRLDIDV